MKFSEEFKTIIKLLAFFTAIAVYIHVSLQEREAMRGLVLQQLDVVLYEQTERMIEDMKNVQIIDVQPVAVDSVLPDADPSNGHSPISGRTEAPASR